MEGLDEAEQEIYFEDNLKIIPLFEVDILETLTPYMGEEDKEEEVWCGWQNIQGITTATEREMQVSQRVQASMLEELNLADADADVEWKTILIAKEMELADKAKMIGLLRQYKDVFAWSFEDI